jgi:hypothetical protein
MTAIAGADILRRVPPDTSFKVGHESRRTKELSLPEETVPFLWERE